jgi:hypothetical protein
VILNTAKIPKRQTKSAAALKIRMSCVLGSTTRHINVQRTAISDMRKTKDIMLSNISIL